MRPPDDADTLDFTLRHVTRQFPEHLARALLPPGTVITSARWSDTQLTSRQRRLDRALEVVAGGRTLLEHTEWQVEMEADTSFRMTPSPPGSATPARREAVSRAASDVLWGMNGGET